MRSTIVSAGLLVLTLLSSQGALARPIAIEGNTESDLALRNSDIVADVLEAEARSIDELYDQLEVRTKRRAGSTPRVNARKPAQRAGNKNTNRNPGQPRGGQNRQRNAKPNSNSGQRKSYGIRKAIGSFFKSETGQNIATTLASGVAQRIANGRGGGAQPVYRRGEVEEYLEARTRRANRRAKPRSSRLGAAVGAASRFLGSGTGQTIATTLASGVAQRIANGGAGAAPAPAAIPQPGYVPREFEEYSETQ